MFEELSPPYSTIVVDPPWHYEERILEFNRGAKRETPGGRRVKGTATEQAATGVMPYSTMSVEEIAALSVLHLAAANAHLYLWTTQRYLWDARDIVLGWGFAPSQVLVWCKPPAGLTPGGAYASSAEFVVYARRVHGGGERLLARAGAAIRTAREAAGIGRAELHRLVRGGEPTGIVARWEDDDSTPNPRDWERLQVALPALAAVERSAVIPESRHTGERVDRCWWEWPRGRHSEKPAAFLDIVEQVSPPPYVELFARQPRLGWDSWGYGYESVA